MESKHCLLDYTEELIENNWMLAKYIDGKYHVLKEFGGNVHGYKFIEVNKNDLGLLKDLYSMGSIVNSKEWYKKHKVRPNLATETHTKNRKVLLKNINSERIKKFKDDNKNTKKIVFIQEQYINIIQFVLNLYEKSSELDELCKTEEGTNKLINTYKGYKFNDDESESFEKKNILILDNDMAIDFNDILEN